MSVLLGKKRQKLTSTLTSTLPTVRHSRSQSKINNQAQNTLKPIFSFQPSKTEIDGFVIRRNSQQIKHNCKCQFNRKIRKSIGSLFANKLIAEHLINDQNRKVENRQNRQNFVLKNKIISYTQIKKKQQEKLRNYNKLNIRAMCNLRDTLPNILFQDKYFDYMTKWPIQKVKKN